MAWDVIFYRDAAGDSPITAFLRLLKPVEKARMMREVQLLKEHGNLLPFPHKSHIKGSIWELRTSSAGTRLRMLYSAIPGTRFVILTGFVKDTDKVPPSEIKLAERRLADWLERYERSHHQGS